MPSRELESLAHRIAELEDREAVADLILRLGAMLDQKRFEEASSILADDVGVETPGGSSRGREAVG